MADTSAWTTAVRASHDRFVALVEPLSDAAVEGPSYAKEWSIAQVASHLGSQAEIFRLFAEAGVKGTPAPGRDQFAPVWDRWNAMAPAEQVQQSVVANEAFVAEIEQTPLQDRESYSLSMFGREQDFAGLLAMRLSEHALHTWDIEVVLDDAATLPPSAVELLIDQLGPTVARAGIPAPGAEPVPVATTGPDRTFVLTLDPEVTLVPSAESAAEALVLPAEAFLRLVYGRLDVDHTPAGLAAERLEALRGTFPGF